MQATKKKVTCKQRWKKVFLSLFLVSIGGCSIFEHYTMSVIVGTEQKVILASWSDFASVFDQPKSDDFSYRIEAVDGGPVTRKNHSVHMSWVPVVLLSGGEHILTIGKGKRGWFDPPPMEYFPITVTVETGKSYALVWESGSLVLAER